MTHTPEALSRELAAAGDDLSRRASDTIDSLLTVIDNGLTGVENLPAPSAVEYLRDNWTRQATAGREW